MKTKSLCVLLFCLFSAACARADVWGYAWTDYDPMSNTVVGTCETVTNLSEYYLPAVQCWVLDPNGRAMGYASDEGWFGSGWSVSVEVDVDASNAAPGDLYTTECDSSVESTFWNGLGYYDPYDYQYWMFQYVYVPDLMDYFAGPDGEEAGPDTQIELGTVYAQTKLPACPSTVLIGSVKTYSLADYFPQYKTGIGILASMSVSPIVMNWNGVQIVENMTLKPGNTCPARIGTCDGFHDTFSVGSGGTTAWGDNVVGQRNIFYDQHYTIANGAVLVTGDPNTCSFTCTQIYSCGGKQLPGIFVVTHSYQKSTINSTPVTLVTVTKTKQ
ncbi:MAG: hypothetical protein ACRD3E_06670 [Terriglobales bacterium]